MKGKPEVLLKSFGNGVAMLRFHQGQTTSAVASFIGDLGMAAQEFLIGEPSTDVFVMFEEGHPVTGVELRNTEDEWGPLTEAVQAGGSDGFRQRVANLEVARKALSGASSPS